MTVTLSKAQEKVLQAIETLWGKGYPPTVREIGEYAGLSSTSTVHAHLAYLRKHGFITQEPDKPRTIRIIRP